MTVETMTLIHYSKLPVISVYSVPDQTEDLKPRGLWLSVEGADDWKSWCEAESFGADRLVYEHDVTLCSDARILVLGSGSDLDGFTSRFGTQMTFSRLGTGVDWPAVAACYQGIIIAPYVWTRRLEPHCFWYYGWDCASGCIWDAAAIEEIKLRALVNTAGEKS